MNVSLAKWVDHYNITFIDRWSAPWQYVLHCKSSCSLRYLHVVLNAAVYATLPPSLPLIVSNNLPNPTIDLIQQSTLINTKWGRGRRLGREGRGSLDFYRCRNWGLVSFYLTNCSGQYHQSYARVDIHRYFILSNTLCYGNPAWAGLRCTGRLCYVWCVCDNCSAGIRKMTAQGYYVVL